jgi:hypothetical protein
MWLGMITEAEPRPVEQRLPADSRGRSDSATGAAGRLEMWISSARTMVMVVVVVVVVVTGSGSGGDDDDDVRMDTKLQVLQGKKEVLKCDWEF